MTRVGRQAKRGYTLVELVCVVAIVSILSSIAWPVTRIIVQRHKEQQLKLALSEIRRGIDDYASAYEAGALTGTPGIKAYPPDLESLTRVHADKRPKREGQTLRFMRRVPRDPFSPASVTAEKSWGLRSFVSEPDEPAYVGDVYDVYSLSPQKALDGSSLSSW